MEAAFSIPAVTEWKSGLGVEQPEITKELGMLQRPLEKTVHKVGGAGSRSEGPRLRVWEAVIHFRALEGVLPQTPGAGSVAGLPWQPGKQTPS